MLLKFCTKILLIALASSNVTDVNGQNISKWFSNGFVYEFRLTPSQFDYKIARKSNDITVIVEFFNKTSVKCGRDEPFIRDEVQCGEFLCSSGTIQHKCFAPLDMYDVKFFFGTVYFSIGPAATDATYYVQASSLYTTVIKFVFVQQPISFLENKSFAGSDPHFRTWGGVLFDYMGSCDLVLVRNGTLSSGDVFNVHIRTKIDRWWSYIEKIALQMGEKVFEIQGATGDILGEGEHLNKDIIHVGLFTSFKKYTHFNPLTNTNHFTYMLNDKGNNILIVNGVFGSKHEMAIILTPSYEVFGSSSGLLGSFPFGIMVAPDNKTILTDANEFAEKWQVSQITSDNLFEAAENYPFDRCLYPIDKPTETVVTKDVAESICEEEKDLKDICVFDVMATGSYDVAELFHTENLFDEQKITEYEARMACRSLDKYSDFCIKVVLESGNLEVVKEFDTVWT